MVRATQLLHPQREPAVPRPAATVLLLRDAPEGVEVLMTRRSPTASFAPGAYVFPGGVDAATGEHVGSGREAGGGRAARHQHLPPFQPVAQQQHGGRRPRYCGFALGMQ